MTYNFCIVLIRKPKRDVGAQGFKRSAVRRFANGPALIAPRTGHPRYGLGAMGLNTKAVCYRAFATCIDGQHL